jgi:diphthamide biosynthesis protein 3
VIQISEISSFCHSDRVTLWTMASYYDEVEVRAPPSSMEKDKLTSKQIEDMEFDEENLLFHSPCPCGDRFEISLVSSNLVLYCLPVTDCCAEQTQLQEGEDIARCPSCSLIIRVIYDPVISSGENDLIVKDDFLDDDKDNGMEVNATVEVSA